MNFTSDNAVGAAPEILAALAEVNDGPTPGYGDDAVTARMAARVSDVFEREAKVYLVATGTAANALSLACLCPPWGTVFCHRTAHVEIDECGAPEFFTGGAKLTLVDGAHGKLTPRALQTALTETAVDVHGVQKAALSLTQATEVGTIYTPDELRALTDVARAHGVRTHLDGTRFANALARLGCSPAELSWRAGVDVLCLGATKNGALAAEAVVLFDEALAWEFELRRKRGGHLLSKMRYLSAQMERFLRDDLWLSLASHANAMADRLAAGLATIPGVEISHPVEANLVFATWPRAAHRAVRAAGAQFNPTSPTYSLDGPDGEMLGGRLVCSFATTEAEVDAFTAALRQTLTG
jgi:threonine aldolase